MQLGKKEIAIFGNMGQVHSNVGGGEGDNRQS